MPRKKKSEPENQIENLYPIGYKLPTAPEQQTEALNQTEDLCTIVHKLSASNEDQQTELLNQTENLDPMGSNVPFSNQDQQTEPLNQIENLLRPIGHKLPTALEQQTEPQSNPREYLAASLTSAQATIAQLFEKQAELRGAEVADTVFDAFESAFISRLEQRLQPFVDVVLPQIQDTHVVLRERTTARVERRQSAFDRLKQIATLVTDECMSLPSGELTGNLLGFASWDVPDHDQQENE